MVVVVSSLLTPGRNVLCIVLSGVKSGKTPGISICELD